MNLLSNEILNKYLDGELDTQKSAEVEELLKTSEADRKRFNVLKLIHEELSLIEEDKVPNGFTNRVMANISKKFVLPRQQNYFILSVAAVFILICVGIVVYISAAIISSSAPQAESIQVTETVHRFSDGLITELRNLLSSKNLSIIGSIFSLGIMISGYFFYLPADIEWIDHIVSFLLFSYLFYQLSVTSILFGKKDKKIDLVIIISYFLLFFKDIYTFTKLIVLELGVAVLGFLDIFVLFIDDNIKILIWLIYIGTLGLLAASFFKAKNVIMPPSFLAAIKPKPFKSKVLKFVAVFALLLFFYYFVYNIILEWLEFSLDDPIIVVGILFFITRRKV
ncbi:MAG: hypothetical protein IIA49_14125 [Bacteroidetes bacterium]|nr:hypothetical protein [Bacteroidota bacterium]